MAKFSEQMQDIFEKYIEAEGNDPVPLEEVAAWAIKKGLYEAAPKNLIKICCEDLARSLRQERRTDEKGRTYRAKHCVREKRNGKQYTLWADIDKAPPTFMSKSLQQRRRAIVDHCFQIKQDVDHYNDLQSDEDHIQLILDFTDDVAELEALSYKSPSGDEEEF